jgi:hypothetical protein
MKHFQRAVAAFFLGCLIATLFCGVAGAQGPAELSAAEPAKPTTNPEPVPANPAANPEPLPNAPEPQNGGMVPEGQGWRGAVSIYGWFAGTHGTVGVLGHDASIHMPFSDLFHFLKGIVPIAVEADKGRFVMPIDYLWVKLGDDKALPITDIGQTSVNAHFTESILTPKIGYRLYNGEHLKVDALGGIRYWYLGQNLTLEPSGLGFSKSANWVDGLGGARFILPVGEKAAVTISGDAGAGGANLDYQVIGLFTYQFKPHLGLGLGWRYLDVDYRVNQQVVGPVSVHKFIWDVAQSGALAGLYFNFGGKPPVPPTASCSAAPSQVLEGEPVTVTATGSNFNPKHPLTYAWNGNGAKLSGNNTQTATIDTTGMAGDFAKGILGKTSSYTASATITDTKEKKNNTASCTASYTVNPRPVHPPVVNCSANPSALAINQSGTVTMTASSPDNRPLSYSWTNTGGQFSGSGTNASVTATNADAGNTITVTGTATDDRKLSTSCTATITVPAVEKVKEVEDWGECTFEKNPKKPWRVDNDCKDVLDKLALRIQQMPNGKVAIVGYKDQVEVVNAEHIGAQRAVNVKYYMTTDELGPKVDATRLEPREGGTKGKATHFYFVPQGATFTQEESVTVDETAVQGQSRSAAPAPKKTKKASTSNP